MKKQFKIGDHVSWNSEAGRVRGSIVKVHTRDVSFKGYTHHASRAEPQFEIRSDRTDHVALHKGGVLRHLAGRKRGATIGKGNSGRTVLRKRKLAP